MMKKAPLVIVEGRQAVLLPDEFRFDGSDVTVRRDPESGDVILSNTPPSWEVFFEGVRQGEVPSDFMMDREQGNVTRDPFEGWSEPAAEGVTGDLREARTATSVPAIVGFEGFSRTPEFARMRRAVIEGRMSFDQAVKEIIANLDLDAGRAANAHGGSE